MGKQKPNGKVKRVEEWSEEPELTVNDPDGILESKLNKPKIKDMQNIVNLIFKHNRTFELTIGKKIFIFGPKECKEFPAKFINHPDFIQQKDYFMVKEVK